jgi:hypothetical protein
MRRYLLLLISLPLFYLTTPTYADEGMWQPHQLPQLRDELLAMGLEIDPNKLSSLDDFPLNAIVSLGGCSASFVSPKGLVVTNHHCVYGSVQYNSSTDNNLLQDGFLAKQINEEVPAAPGTRVYVTEAVTDVSEQMLAGTSDDMSGIDRYQTLETNRKALIKDCEQTQIHRCEVSAYHHGLEYWLIKRLEIRDVRLVYAPATSIGKYGGDIDNWQWPRHTGDFGFYRAYVGKDGKPADHSESNVPYTPVSFLQVSSKGVDDGDFVMAAGYPGSTNRYRTASEIKQQFTWFYPKARQYREDIIATIEDASPADSQARLNYASTIASLANYAKNYQSMEESFHRSDFLKRRQTTEKRFKAWLSSDAEGYERLSASVQNLEDVIAKEQSTKELDLWRGYFGYATLPSVAGRLYRLAIEKEKPDAERESGYQERDMTRFKQSMQRISRNYDEAVDKAILSYVLNRYAELDKNDRLQSFDQFFQLNDKTTKNKLDSTIDKLYAKSTLDDETVRLAWMDESVDDFKRSKDPMIQYAVATYDQRYALEQADKDITGQLQRWRPAYMEAFIAFNRSQGQAIYADANSSLRITYGQVKGNQPKDGLINTPFTTLEGIVEKDTGVTPFDSPQQQLDLIRQKQYGKYKLDAIDSVPVNFLNTLDITGGNSGSATLNAKGQLVGLLFDGVYESIIGDWDFDDELNRAIAVDTRYMLWVMEYLDDATNLLGEMAIVD